MWLLFEEPCPLLIYQVKQWPSASAPVHKTPSAHGKCATADSPNNTSFTWQVFVGTSSAWDSFVRNAEEVFAQKLLSTSQKHLLSFAQGRRAQGKPKTSSWGSSLFLSKEWEKRVQWPLASQNITWRMLLARSQHNLEKKSTNREIS